LQRSHVALLALKLSPEPAQPVPRRSGPGLGPVRDTAAGEDIRSLARGELVAIDAEVAQALPRSADRETRLHLADIRSQIDRDLHPPRAIVAPGGASR